MIFNSLQYALFLPIVVIVYFILPQRTRWFFLLAASYYFYMCWNAKYAVLLLLSTVVTFFAAQMIHRAADRNLKIFCLAATLIINLGILFIFKYFNFFNETIAGVVQMLGVQYEPSQLSLVLPVGISFYTFQSLGYTLDVYKGKTEPMKHFGKYALFVSFFPQLAAGPIGRIESLQPQFDMRSKLHTDNLRSGLLLIGQGLFKKLVIADRLAVLVNTVYNSPADHNGIHFIAAALFYSIQIYCDFSGYSDIAIGSAKMLGIDLMENFRRPYLAATVADFWKRWHISLTSWFRDYVYIPLGGNRKRHLVNILIVFLVSGLWHGASLTFILWGLLNGIYQVAGIITRPYTDKLKAALHITGQSVTYHVVKRVENFLLISFTWIFFRANDLADLKLILARLVSWDMSFLSSFNSASLGMDRADFIASVVFILLLFVYELLQEKTDMSAFLRREPLVFRWAVYLAIVTIILVFGVYGDANSSQFIYFQF